MRKSISQAPLLRFCVICKHVRTYNNRCNFLFIHCPQRSPLGVRLQVVFMF